MGFEFAPGKYQKSILKEKLRSLRLTNENTMEFFSMLQKAGYIKMNGSKIVLVKKPLKF